MNEYVTIDRTDPQFKEYLLGRFSREYRALPMRSLNINRSNERVTFQLVRKNEVAHPGWVSVFAQVLRLDLLTLTMTPAAVVAAIQFDRLISTQSVFLVLVSLFLLHGAAFCRNDFIDHMRGVDRLNEKGGSRVIQRGWMRAVAVQRLYGVLLGLAAVVAAPVLMAWPELVLLSVFVGGMGILGYSRLRWGLGHWIFGDLAVFLCLGPLLSLGTSWVSIRDWPLDTILLGFYFGVMALVYLEVRHTISMVVDDEAGLSTLPVKLGFDRAKVVIVGLLFVAAFLAAAIMGEIQPGAMSLFGLPLVGWIFWLAHKVFVITSPLSSGLYELPKRLVHLHLSSGAYFIAVMML